LHLAQHCSVIIQPSNCVIINLFNNCYIEGCCFPLVYYSYCYSSNGIKNVLTSINLFYRWWICIKWIN
jgi:hypothetical protein